MKLQILAISSLSSLSLSLSLLLFFAVSLFLSLYCFSLPLILSFSLFLFFAVSLLSICLCVSLFLCFPLSLFLFLLFLSFSPFLSFSFSLCFFFLYLFFSFSLSLLFSFPPFSLFSLFLSFSLSLFFALSLFLSLLFLTTVTPPARPPVSPPVLGGCAQPISQFPGHPPLPTQSRPSTNTQSGFNHYVHMLPAPKPTNPPPPPSPRADAPCSPGTTAPVVLDPRAAADRVLPRSPGPFTPDALDLRTAANQIDLDGATTPTVSTPPSSPNSATPPLSDTADGRTIDKYCSLHLRPVLGCGGSVVIIITVVVARTVGMTGRWRCAVLLSPRLGKLPCRRREGEKNAASKEGTGLGQRWDRGNGWRTPKSPHAPR